MSKNIDGALRGLDEIINGLQGIVRAGGNRALLPSERILLPLMLTFAWKFYHGPRHALGPDEQELIDEKFEIIIELLRDAAEAPLN